MTFATSVVRPQVRWLMYGAALLVAGVLFLLMPGEASADVGGDFKFTITAQSGGGSVSGVAVSVACTGGAITGVGTTSATGTLFATPPAGASCGAGDSYIAYALEKSGMVTLTALPGGTHEADELNAVTSTMLYQVRVEVSDQKATAFTHSDLDTITLNSIAASTTLSTVSLFGNTGTNIALVVRENGYVSATTTNVGLLRITPVSSSQFLIQFASNTPVGADITSATTTVRGLVFSHIVKTQRESDSAPLAGATVSAGGVTCNEESSNTGTYFCPVLVAGDGGTDDIHILLDGYVKNVTGDTPNRDGDSASAATTTVSSINFSHKVAVVDELGTALTADRVTAGANDVTCLISTSNAFCAVLLADDDTVGQGFDINKNGYVSTTIALGANRAASNTAQQLVTMTSSNGVAFGNKVTLLGNSNSAISGATVLAGDGLGTTCTESGTTGVYYCAVPEANTSRTAEFRKAGFTTRQADFGSDRTASTSAQVTLTYNQFHSAPSGGGSISGVPVKAKPSVTSITLGDGSGTTAMANITIKVVGSEILRYKIATTQAGLATADYPQWDGQLIPYTLSGTDGVKTLWFRFMSSDGGESSDSSRQITLRTTAVPAPATPTPTSTPPAKPAEPAAPAEPPKVSVPIVPLVELPRVPGVITVISPKPIVPDLTPISIAVLAEGDLFMIEDATAGASVYWFTGGYKRPFASEKAFMSWFPSFDRVAIKRVKKDEISYLSWGPAMPYKPGSKLIKVPDDVKTYSIQSDGSLCHVKDEKDAAKLFGKSWNKKVDDMAVSQLLGTYKIKDECVVA